MEHNFSVLYTLMQIMQDLNTIVQYYYVILHNFKQIFIFVNVGRRGRYRTR